MGPNLYRLGDYQRVATACVDDDQLDSINTSRVVGDRRLGTRTRSRRSAREAPTIGSRAGRACRIETDLIAFADDLRRLCKGGRWSRNNIDHLGARSATAGVGHREGNRVRATLRVGMLRIARGAGVAIPKIPGVRPCTCCLASELDVEAYAR